jgi:hypothetical protein
MRRSLLAALALMLAGCSDGAVNPIVGAAVQEVLPGRGAPEAAPAAAPLTREAITRADVATIRARLLGDERPTILFAASENGGYVTYASSIRQALTLRGSQITASRGLGHDLLSATSSGPDPLATPIPPAQWPAGVVRSYEFSAFAPQGRVETYRCRFEFGEVREVTILQVRHRGVEIAEICEGPAGRFENLHLADVETGFVWRSLQWLGTGQGLVDLEVVLPFTGRRS